MKKSDRDYTQIKGWGIDQDPLDVPSYPMKRRTENDNKGMVWQRPVRQRESVEILRSTERPNLSAVFGTPVPPWGLSGQIRRFAFRYSESRVMHWIALLVADRVQMFEGVADDVKKGHFPDIFSELGGRSELKYNPTGFAKKSICSIAVVTLFVAIMRRK